MYDGPNLEDQAAVQASLSFDKFDLDNELERNSDILEFYARLHAQAEFEMKQAEKELKILKANLDLSIREDPESYGIKYSVTESSIKQAMRRATEYDEANTKYHKAMRVFRLCDDIFRIAIQRKSLLEAAKDLFLNSYYVTPYGPKGSREMEKGRQVATEQSRRLEERAYDHKKED